APASPARDHPALSASLRLGRVRPDRRPPLTLPRLSPAGRRVVRALALGVALSLAVTLLSQIGAVAGWQARAVDTFLFLRERRPETAVALVTIDEDAFAALGERQPLPRAYLADLADFLLESGARVVALDLVASTPTDAAADAALVD